MTTKTLEKTNGVAAAQTAEAKSGSEVLSDILDKSLYQSLAEKGDISNLSSDEKTSYMRRLCESLGLNHLTQPFLPLILNGKQVLYATRGATDQLASVHKLTREILKTERIEDVYIATARVSGPDGRFDISTGAVAIGNLNGDKLANALMKAETKAKRRATLCYCGLGFLDESEIETIPRERVEFVSPPSKGQLVEQVKESAQPEEKELISPADARAARSRALNEMSPEHYAWRVEIENILSDIGKGDAVRKNILNKFDFTPDKREAAINEIRKEAIRFVIASDKWSYSEDATSILLDEKFGITVISDADPSQIEACVNAFRKDGYLK